jgi:hypothetical protein
MTISFMLGRLVVCVFVVIFAGHAEVMVYGQFPAAERTSGHEDAAYHTHSHQNAAIQRDDTDDDLRHSSCGLHAACCHLFLSALGATDIYTPPGRFQLVDLTRPIGRSFPRSNHCRK